MLDETDVENDPEDEEVYDDEIAINDIDTQENSVAMSNSEVNNKDTVKCDICNTSYSNLSGLNRHKKTQMHSINA